MKTKKVQGRRRKTLRQRGKALRHKKTLQRRRKTLRGGGDTITFTDNKNNKCIFEEEVNNILVKRGENRIGTFDIDEKNFKYNELPVYDLGNMPSSTTPITEIISPKKTTSDEEQLQRFQKARKQSQAEQLKFSRQFSYGKIKPAGLGIRNIVAALQAKEKRR
jgi:hypothetical protein